MKHRPNKLFLSDQGKLSRYLLAQPPRQFTMAPEHGRYVPLGSAGIARPVIEEYAQGYIKAYA
jgi:hypothetical protein